MNQDRRLFRPFSGLALSLVLAACGGGGGDDSPDPVPPAAAASTPAVQALSPPTGSGVNSGDLTQVRAKILLAASQAAVNGTATTALPTTSGGKITQLPFEQYWGFTLTADNKIYGLSRPGETLLVDPKLVKWACFFGGRAGWGVNGGTSVACGPMLTGEGSTVPNYAKLPNTANNDAGTYVVIMKGALKSGKDGSGGADDYENGEVLWGDFASERKFTFESTAAAPMQATLMTSGPNAGLIEYGMQGVGYQQATVSQGGGKLRYDFGSNRAGGFGKDGQLTQLDPSKPLMFVFHSNKSGADGKDGWGYGSTTPSTLIGWWQVNETTGNGYVEFTGVPCGAAGNISVYKPKTLNDQGVVTAWETDTDFFGAAWGVIQEESDPIQMWKPGTGVSFDRDKYQIVLPAC